MIINFNKYIKEASTFNKLNVEQEFIKKLYKNFDIIINDTFNYKEIDFEDLDINDIEKKLNDRKENILFFIITKNEYLLIINYKEYNEYHIYEYSLYTKYIEHKSITRKLLNNFLVERDVFDNSKNRYYYIYNFTNLSDKNLKIERENIKNIKELFDNIFKNKYKNYYKKLKEECKELLKISTNEKYKNEIESDIQELDFFIKNIKGFNQSMKISSISQHELNIKILNYNELYDICKIIGKYYFTYNINFLNIIKYRKFDKEIEKNPLKFKELRKIINDEKILTKYKHLEDSSKFDLI